MKAIHLIENDTYIDLIAYITSNNFGDQIIEFSFEHFNGSKTTETISFPEGNWENTSQDNLMRLYLMTKMSKNCIPKKKVIYHVGKKLIEKLEENYTVSR